MVDDLLTPCSPGMVYYLILFISNLKRVYHYQKKILVSGVLEKEYFKIRLK